jgi:hypothetical protein
MKQRASLLVRWRALILAAALAASEARGQVLYGTIVGTVKDSTGAVVPGASVTTTNIQTNQTRATETNAVGSYSFTNVLPGTYNLEISAGGFQTYVQTDLQVTINTITRVDVELRLGQVAERLTVSATAAVLQTDKADVRVELGTKELTQLPLANYRNYQSLINLVPGATPQRFQNSVNDTPMRDLTTNINGTNRNANNERLDGALNKMNIITSHTLYVPPAESIETVNISTNAFDAEQGMSGGAAINVVTKSGTNEFHGALFAFNDNNALRAKNFFYQEKRTPKSIDNIAGAAAGGPIAKNTLFFFADWEGLRERKNFSRLSTVPTGDQREGNFGRYGRPIYDPLTGNLDGSGRTLFPGAVVPGARQSAITRKMQALVPLPNLAGTSANYFSSGTQLLDRDNYDVKINWNRTDRHTIWGKYSRMDAHVECTPALGEAGGNPLCAPSSKQGTADTVVQVANLGHTWVLGARLLMDSTVGYSRLAQRIVGGKYGEKFGLEALGIPGTNGPDIRQSGQPAFVISGYETLGDPSAANPAFRTDAVYTHASNVNWSAGSHDIRLGFEQVRFHQNDWQPNVGGGPRGQFNFDGGVTALRGGPSPDQFNAHAAFLLGLPQAMSKGLQYYDPQSAREWQFGWYFRDRWQVSQSLTLTLGLRYEYYPLLTRTDQGIERYDMETNTVLIGRRGGNPDNVGIDVSKKLFAPRLGLAYRLGSRTVLRSGYGISIDPATISGAIQRPYPVAFGTQFPGVNSFQPFRPIELGIPPIAGPDVSSGVIRLPAEAQTTTQAKGLFARGYIQSWNLVLERRLPGEFVGTVGYVGTRTVRQPGTVDLNAGRPGLGQAGRPLFARFGRTATTNLLDPAFSGSYHSLQATVNRPFGRGLFVKGSYTFSKVLNFNDDSGGGLSFNVPEHRSRNRALGGFDRTHIVQMSWIYDLPFGPKKKWARNARWLGAIARDWQINSIFSAYSGTPFTVTSSATSLNAPGSTQTADQVASKVQKLGGIGSASPWFDPTAFRAVTEVRFGNTGRNILRGPGVVNLDLGLFRSFAPSERFQLRFSGEAFNASNTPHFGNPAANVSTRASFGTITSAQDDQRVIRFGLRLSF